MRSSTRSNTILILLLSFCILSSAADKPPIAVQISGPENVSQGEGVMLQVVLKNVSEHTVPLWLGDPYTVLIRDENGHEPRRNTGERNSSSKYSFLQPGESTTELVNIGSEYDLSVPGKYVVQCRRPLNHGDPKSPMVESNEITINVIPPKKDGKQ